MATKDVILPVKKEGDELEKLPKGTVIMLPNGKNMILDEDCMLYPTALLVGDLLGGK